MAFEIEPHTRVDKGFHIVNKELDIYLRLDYDDVNHERQDEIADILVEILNHVEPEFWAHALEDFENK